MGRAGAYVLRLLLAACVSMQCCSEPVATAEEPSAEETAPPLRSAALVFAGDVMCHYPQIAAARRNGGYDFAQSFEYVRPIFQRADAAIVNLETVISPDGRYSGYPAFSSPRELAAALRDAGVDIAVTANNHCCDRGARGIRSTIACLDSLGLLHTGTFADSADYAANRILRFERNGIRFAMYNATYGTNGMPVADGCAVNMLDTLAMASALESMADADCRIVFLHWGEEYQRYTNASQRAVRDFLQCRGADIVIGSHPHVIQPASAAGGRIFVSSLGNFVSNQRKRYSDGGLMAEVEVAERRDGGFDYRLKLIPVWVKLPGYRILPPSVADTLRMTAAERMQYRQFVTDTEQLLFSGKFL